MAAKFENLSRLYRSMKTIQMYIETFALEHKVTDEVIQLASELLTDSSKPSSKDVASAIVKASEKHQENIRLYEQLVDRLCDAVGRCQKHQKPRKTQHSQHTLV